MMDNNKNKGSGEFDDGFDDDFSDVNFDDVTFDDASYDELADDESEYEGDDFESEDWGDDDAQGKDKKKPKKQKTGGGLSFNAIVIIGAVVLGGGVLAFNVMRETGKVEAARPSMFQSILGIGGIMDGLLFGEKDGELASGETVNGDSAGFLNDPDASIPATVPPQPAPIAPVDDIMAGNEPLTPMPSDMGTESPRGPDDAPMPDMAATDTPAAVLPEPENVADQQAAPPPSAEDILKQAMANREQKQQDNTTADSAPSPTDKEALEEALQEKPVVAGTQAESMEDGAAADMRDTVSPIQDISAPRQQDIPAANPPADVAVNNEAVTILSEKLDNLLQRMDRIEGDLDSIRDNKGQDTEAIQKTVDALKRDLATLKDRPVTRSAEDSADTVAEKPKSAPVKKKAAKAVKPADEPYISSPSPAAKSSAPVTPKAEPKTAASGNWELRAAQPGRAWVSKPGERDMQAVAVGDTLPGIGRITAITFLNGRWAVAGTQGNIQQ